MVTRLSRYGWVLALVVVVAGLLGGTAPRDGGSRAAYAQEGVSDEHCAVTPFDIAGQGNYAVPGDALAPGVADDQIVELTGAALHAVTTIGSQPVAILVVDDFFEYADDVPHGRLVTDLLKGMIQAHPTYAFEPSQPVRFPYVWVWEPPGDAPGGTLLLVEVDIEDGDTAGLRDEIERTVTTLRREFDVSRIVLNMSFVLVPCVTPDYDVVALREARVRRETDYVPLLAEIARSRNIVIDLDRTAADVLAQPLHEDAAYRAVTVVLANYALRVARPEPGAEPDQLHAYLQSLTGPGTPWNSSADPVIVAVGAAGDMERRVASFAPAAWAEVAGVSASLGPRAPWPSSNQGQVMLPGGLFPVDDVYLIGTSFAAPVLSLNMAFYLTHEDVCADPPLDLAVPRFLDEPLARVVNRACKPPFAPIMR